MFAPFLKTTGQAALHVACLKMFRRQSESPNKCIDLTIVKLENTFSSIKAFHKHVLTDQICEGRGDHWCGETNDETMNSGFITKMCVPGSWICNSYPECADNSDENEC